MAPQASKKCGLLTLDHNRLGSYRSNGIGSDRGDPLSELGTSLSTQTLGGSAMAEVIIHGSFRIMARYFGVMLTLGFISLASLTVGQQQVLGATLVHEKYVYGDNYVSGTINEPGLRFYKEQEADRWCWAATATMIMSFHDQPQWLQCIQADDSFPGKSEPRTCCDDKESPLCNRTGWPHFERYGFVYSVTDAPLEWDQLKEQIDNNLPLAVAVKWFTGGGHMGAVIGYQIHDDGEKYVLVVDPDGFHGHAILRFGDLFGTAADGSYTHWRTYYNISR